MKLLVIFYQIQVSTKDKDNVIVTVTKLSSLLVSVHLSTTIIGLVILIGIMLIMITVCSIIVLLLLVELYVKRYDNILKFLCL